MRFASAAALILAVSISHASAGAVMTIDAGGQQVSVDFSSGVTMTFSDGAMRLSSGETYPLDSISSIAFPQAAATSSSPPPAKLPAFTVNRVPAGITVANLPRGQADISVYAPDGSLLRRQRVNGTDSHTAHLTLDTMVRGIYLIAVRAGDKVSASRQLVVH